MKIAPIKNESQYQKALETVDKMFNKKVKKGTPEGDQLEILLLLIKDFEDKHYPIAPPDPVEAIKIIMKERGLKNKDMTRFIGSKSYVSQVLRKKKPLTAQMMKILHKKLGIPAEILLA